MAVHNWVRCHWRNGRHDLHDLPQAWRETVEAHFARQRARTEDLGVVRVATLDALELAWVECEVSLGNGECGFTYRRARAIHALVRPTAQGGAWTRREVESLLGQRYGEPVERGLPAQHPALAYLRFPEDASRALGLFVGRAEILPSELLEHPGALALEAAPAAVATPVVEHAASARPLHTLLEAHAVGEGLDQGGPEEWFRRFKLIPPLELPMDRPALQGVRPAADPDGFGLRGAAAARVANAPSSERSAEDVEGEPSASASVVPATDPDSAPGPAPAVEADEHEEQPRALFDLSTPQVLRPPAPPSSLSGLLGPSHTGVW